MTATNSNSVTEEIEPCMNLEFAPEVSWELEKNLQETESNDEINDDGNVKTTK